MYVFSSTAYAYPPDEQGHYFTIWNGIWGKFGSLRIVSGPHDLLIIRACKIPTTGGNIGLYSRFGIGPRRICAGRANKVEIQPVISMGDQQRQYCYTFALDFDPRIAPLKIPVRMKMMEAMRYFKVRTRFLEVSDWAFKEICKLAGETTCTPVQE